MEELNSQANYPRLSEKSALYLVTLAKRLLCDSNMQVMVQAIKLVGHLAKGQRRFFDNYARQFFPLLILKFKDKKPQVLQETHNALDSLLYCITLEQTLEEVGVALEDKTPSVRTNICKWLQRALVNCPQEQVERAAPRLVFFLKKNTDESLAEVRNAAFSIIGSLLKNYPEVVQPAIRDLNKAKLRKIEETIASPSKAPAAELKPQKKEPKPAPQAKSRATAPAKQPEEDAGAVISAEDAENTVSCVLPSELLERLKGATWKEKQSGLLELAEWVPANVPSVAENSDAFVRFIRSLTKDWKENNVNVNKAAFEAVTAIAQTCKVSKRAGALALSTQALEKFADTKLLDTVCALVLGLCESLSPRFVAALLVKHTAECTKPKVVAECCAVLGRVLSEYGAPSVALGEVVGFAKGHLNQANPVMKKAAGALLVVLYSHVGQPLLAQLADVKEATLKALEEEFGRTQLVRKTEYKHTRGEEGPLDGAFPRADIAAQVTTGLLNTMNDKNWPTRKEGLEAVEGLLAASGMRIQPTGLEVLFKALKARVNDNNKSLVRLSLALVSKLATALGPECGRFSKIIVRPVLSNLADKQSLLRLDALAAIDKWAEEAGPECIINLSAAHLAQENPDLRTELLN